MITLVAILITQKASESQRKFSCSWLGSSERDYRETGLG